MIMCIFDEVPAPVMMLDTSLEVCGANFQSMHHHGVRELDSLKASLRESTSWGEVISKAQEALRGKASTAIYAFKNRDSSSEKWSKAVITPIRDVTGAIIGVSVMEKDYTFKRSLLAGLQELKNNVS